MSDQKQNLTNAEMRQVEKLPSNIKRRVLTRFVFGGATGSLNYEKMMALAYCYSVLPAMKFLYRQNPDGLQKALQTQLAFFNTNGIMAPFVIGADLAIEESQGVNSLPTVTGIKTSLMGPLAGIGDTLLLSTPGAIFGGIAASMAVKGNPVGVILWLVVMVAIKCLVIPLYKMGYNSGAKLVTTLRDELTSITDAISVVGLMVVGALIPTVINATVKAKYVAGKLVVNGQHVLDSISPGMIPVLLVLLVYWLLGKKRMTPVRIILVVLVLSIALSAIGFL